MDLPTKVRSDLLTFNDLPGSISRLHYELRADFSSRQFRHHIEQDGQAIEIDYRRDAVTFNKAFFLRNYLKCISYLRRLPPSLHFGNERLFDIGGGAGPFSLAAQQYRPIRATILDRSREQIMLAWMLSQSVGLDHICETKEVDVFEATLDPAVIRLACYWACENTNILKLEDDRRIKLFGRLSILIDYPAIVLAEAHTVRRLGGHVANLVIAEERVCPTLTKIIGQPIIKYGGVCLGFPI